MPGDLYICTTYYIEAPCDTCLRKDPNVAWLFANETAFASNGHARLCNLEGSEHLQRLKKPRVDVDPAFLSLTIPQSTILCLTFVWELKCLQDTVSHIPVSRCSCLSLLLFDQRLPGIRQLEGNLLWEIKTDNNLGVTFGMVIANSLYLSDPIIESVTRTTKSLRKTYRSGVKFIGRSVFKMR